MARSSCRIPKLQPARCAGSIHRTGYGEFAYVRILTDQEKISEKLTVIQQQAQLLSGEQDNTLQTILNLLAEPVIFQDGKRILTVNPAAHNMLPEMLPGEPILSLFVQWAQRNLDQVLNAITIVPYETAVSTQDGTTISIHFYNLPLHYQQQEIYVLFIHEWANGASTPPQTHLTSRETEVLHLLATDHDDKTIAEILGIAPRTVKYHLQNVQKKLQVSSRAAAIHKAWEYDLFAKY